MYSNMRTALFGAERSSAPWHEESTGWLLELESYQSGSLKITFLYPAMTVSP